MPTKTPLWIRIERDITLLRRGDWPNSRAVKREIADDIEDLLALVPGGIEEIKYRERRQ